ncbi:hypothetical protein BWQ96_05075 [Gracilariopsis chorda]|uniref:Uncharacterized protein n=1 Tax=Gracilariopsis chorda TaxID=448386 RepID=A0A2V3IST9_9FLOR|nr:hypothetical protein BWQ96_05075 [Gracilariopsis chorda]|eukprot:PXF45174.1 hypothetical protein BWQ96_05075 [Gracilariopsis chorda]
MTPETMTLTKALVELKLLKKRINKKVEQLEVVVVKRGGVLPAAIKSEADFIRTTKADWQSLNALMSRRRKIKTALVVANAVTKVKIAGEEMTIAEAIERKSLVSTDRLILNRLKFVLSQAQGKVDRHNRELDERINQLLETSYGNRESQLSKEDYERIARPFKEGNTSVLIDPLNCATLMTKMEESVDAFESEVDVALSIANATTEISIS